MKIMVRKKNNASEKNTVLGEKKENLRDKILAECIKIVSESGSVGINMREISRRLKISHTAPYKHFKSKD